MKRACPGALYLFSVRFASSRAVYPVGDFALAQRRYALDDGGDADG